MTQDAIAEKYKINRSLVSKWVKDKKKITAAAATAHKKLLKIRPGNKYSRLFSLLMTRFKNVRSKGYGVDFNWLWSKARVAYRELTGNPSATVRKHVITTFLKRHNIRMRARQRNKKAPKQDFEVGLKKWHATTREKLVRTARNDGYDKKWGRFTPRQRLNVDQSPLPFAVTTKRTYEYIGEGEEQRNHKVWISQPGSGLDKRQCTLQVCFRPTGGQPKIGIIFRGTGKRISADEKEAYHPDVDICFQENAWADTNVSVEWVKRTLTESVKDDERFVLFCDNLTGQVSSEFKEAVAKLGGVVWYGLPGATDLWQPVDAGYAQILKVLIGQLSAKKMARRRGKCREVVRPRIILLSQGKADSNNALGRRSIQEIGRKRVRQSASKSVAEDRLPYDGRWIRRWSYKARGVKELYCTTASSPRTFGKPTSSRRDFRHRGRPRCG